MRRVSHSAAWENFPAGESTTAGKILLSVINGSPRGIRYRIERKEDGKRWRAHFSSCYLSTVTTIPRERRVSAQRRNVDNLEGLFKRAALNGRRRNFHPGIQLKKRFVACACLASAPSRISASLETGTCNSADGYNCVSPLHPR